MFSDQQESDKEEQINDVQNDFQSQLLIPSYLYVQSETASAYEQGGAIKTSAIQEMGSDEGLYKYRVGTLFLFLKFYINLG